MTKPQIPIKSQNPMPYFQKYDFAQCLICLWSLDLGHWDMFGLLLRHFLFSRQHFGPSGNRVGDFALFPNPFGSLFPGSIASSGGKARCVVAARRLSGGVFRLDRNQQGCEKKVLTIFPIAADGGSESSHHGAIGPVEGEIPHPMLVAVQAKNSTCHPPRSVIILAANFTNHPLDSRKDKS